MLRALATCALADLAKQDAVSGVNSAASAHLWQPPPTPRDLPASISSGNSTDDLPTTPAWLCRGIRVERLRPAGMMQMRIASRHVDVATFAGSVRFDRFHTAKSAGGACMRGPIA